VTGPTIATRGTRGTGSGREAKGEQPDARKAGGERADEAKRGLRMDDAKILGLCDRIREISLALHRYLRHGHLEKVYENGLAHRLRKEGIRVDQQHPLAVCDEDGAVLGEYYADLFVEGKLIVELKACQALVNEHTAQNLGYLRASRKEHGLLINFGAPRLEIRKFKL
jgi:GxxExxY protein